MWNVRGHDGKINELQITDCLITVNGIIDEDGEKHVDVTIAKAKWNDDGQAYWEEHKNKQLPADVMENAARWNAWATAAAGCNWNLDNESRWELKKFLFSQPGANIMVYRPKTSGYVEQHGIWLSRGHCFDAQGFAKPLTENEKTITLECADLVTRTFSIPPVAPRFTPGTDEGLIVPLRYGLTPQHVEKIHEFILTANLNLGHHAGSLGLGWVMAATAWHKWIAALDAFPILYVTGPKTSGKDTLCRWLWEVAGFSSGVDAIQAIDTTTLAGVRDAAIEVGNIPLWVNELRKDEDASIKLQGWIRSMFDAQTTTNVNRSQDKKPRRPLMCSGQSIVGSDAEYTRFLLVDLPNYPAAPEMKSKVEDLLPELHRIYCHQASLASREWSHADIVAATRTVKDALRHGTDIRVNDRQLFCYAVPVVGLAALNARGSLRVANQMIQEHGLEKLVGKTILDYAIKSMARGQVVNAQDSAMGTFWDAIQALHARGHLKNEGPTQWVKLVEGRTGHQYVAVWLTFLLRSLIQMDRFGKWDKRLLFAEMRQVKGFIEDAKQVRMGEFARECVTFEEINSLPEWVNELAGVNKQKNMVFPAAPSQT